MLMLMMMMIDYILAFLSLKSDRTVSAFQDLILIYVLSFIYVFRRCRHKQGLACSM